MIKNFFSFEGRMRRRDYWISAIIVPVATVILIFFLVSIAVSVSMALGMLLLLVSIPVLIWHELAENTRRCHDIGMSGWWQLIPFFGIVLLFKGGDNGPNKYGPDPKTGPFPANNTITDAEYFDSRKKRSQFDAEMEAIRAERDANAR